jgi:hypothetical protein
VIQNLPLRERKIDVFFAVVFVCFIASSIIADSVSTLGIEMRPDSASWLARSNWWYAHDADPMFMHPPMWMRFVCGLSAFVYGPFYVVLVWCLLKGRNWVQLPSVMYATMISTITGVVVFGVEFFGEPELRTLNPAKFLAFNLPYVVLPLLLLVRMRKPLPFTRRF